MTDGDRIHGQGIQLTSTQNRDLERVGPPPRRKWPWEDFINKVSNVFVFVYANF